jgi:asparagine synthase (glutamine-hydrolysing)
VLENRTLFEGIQVLPPGSDWIFRGGSLERKGAYFAAREWEDQSPLEPEAYYQKLREVFSQNLPRYFNGSQPVAMSLTGGLDTRMILAWHKATPGSLPCYSFGGMYRDCQDVVVARKVAQACGQSYQVIPVGPQFLSRFAEYAERAVYLTDACAAVNRSADLYVNERAREIAPVRMTGNYGGEVLRRVLAFKPRMPAPGLFRPEFFSQAVAGAETYSEVIRTHPLSLAVFRQAPWHHYGLLALEETQVSLRSPYLDNDFVRTVFRAPQSPLENNDISLRLIADGDSALRRIRTDRGFAGNAGRLQQKISQHLLEFAAKAEYAYDYGMPHWVARADHVFSSFHPERLFLGRHKFAHFRVWYRDALSEYVRQMLLDSRTLQREYLNPTVVEAVVEGHLSGKRNYTTEIHQLLTLELLQRLFIDRR